ncbi:hypothetical protein, partial [Kaarinaea lacus]
MRHNFHHQQSKCCDLQVISFLLMLFIYSGHVNAALPEEEFFADIPEVLTATRLKQPVNEAPASMTIID